MPNWCSNEMVVRGSKERIEEFDKAFKGKPAIWEPAEYLYSEAKGDREKQRKELIAKSKEEHKNLQLEYCFEALYPIPKEVADIGYSKLSGSKVLSKDRFEALMVPEKWLDGYTWCVSHWGTKWDVYGKVDCLSKEDEECSYAFNSAWSPPIEWLEKVAADWADLYFKLIYEEGGCMFAGKKVYENGKCIEVFQVEDDNYRDFVVNEFGYDPFEGMED